MDYTVTIINSSGVHSAQLDIPSSDPHPRFMIDRDAPVTALRPAGLGIGKTPTAMLDVAGNAKIDGTLDVQGNVIISDPNEGVILTSPNGTQYKITVDNNGQLISTPH